MLAAFDSARDKARAHEVETYHGNVAESVFRKWLTGFLPKRYGVTAGYIISQGVKSDQKAPHFDVIIYDALSSPVLWIEEDPGSSEAGQSMAIPAEYVLGVIEVKSALSSSTVEKALEHLGDLQPLLQGVDEPSEKYKLYLPKNFFCAIVFFELRKSEEHSEIALTKILNGLSLRGFIGGLVLRGEGHVNPASGRITILQSQTPIRSLIKDGDGSLLRGMPMTATTKVTDTLHFGVILPWMEAAFSQFAFDLIAIMQGTYESGRLSTFHGMGSSDQESKSSQTTPRPHPPVHD